MGRRWVKLTGFLCAALGLGPGLSAKNLCVRILERQAFQEFEVRENPGRWVHVSASAAGLRLDGVAAPCLQTSGADFELRRGSFQRTYPGDLHVECRRGVLVCLNRVDLDRYVAGVAAAESGGQGPLEYRKALAWTARAFALRLAPRHREADLCDLTHCQVYQGEAPPWQDWIRIAQSAAAIRRPLPRWPLFTANCGGLLDDPAAVWGRGDSAPGFPKACSVGDEDLCRNDPDFRWSRRIPRTQVQAALMDLGLIPEGAKLLAWGPQRRTPAGRALAFWIRVRLADGSLREPSLPSGTLNTAIGRRWGWNCWPSLAFTVTPAGDWDILDGKGRGHGAGLCLAGARRLAERGWSAERILDFYFPASPGEK